MMMEKDMFQKVLYVFDFNENAVPRLTYNE